MNMEKSATNSRACIEDAQLLYAPQAYKCLEITENSVSEVISELLKHIKFEMIKRIEKLCKTKLNAKNN
ncbi:hypothetical protein NUSPORA_01695 [Nucleospora cyclopteri]